MKIWFVLLILGGCLYGLSGEGSKKIHQVGAVVRDYSDPLRRSWNSEGPRPLQTIIWYPADPKVNTSQQTIAIFKTGKYKFDAPFDLSERQFPLIVVSHGTGGSAASIAWLCASLAEAGYIVASVNHHGNTGAEDNYLLEGFMLWWERAADIKVLIDRLLSDPQFSTKIDPTRIGVAGFSIGGYTALATVGACLDVERWKPYCKGNEKDPICHLPPEAEFKTEEVWAALDNNRIVKESWVKGNQSYLDRRIKGAFVLAPVVGPIIVEQSLREVRIPVKLIVGNDDDQGVPSMNAIPFSKLIPTNTLEILPGVGHYVFLSEGTWWGKLLAGKFLNDPKGISRIEIHKSVSKKAIDFFDQILK